MLRIAPRTLFLILPFVALFIPYATAQIESATFTVPIQVTFVVTDVNSVSVGSPTTTTSFQNAILLPLKRVRISVKADTTAFSSTSGNPIPASYVSWTVGSISGGAGSNGSLSGTAYTQVFLGNLLATSGSVDLNWNLAAIGSGVRAGTHTITLRWKIESVF